MQSCSAEKRSSISAAFDAAGDRRRELAVLETEDLTYTYSVGTPFEKTAVNNVSLKIEEGEMIGVMGHTGSGKSTLIQHFNGLLRPTSGRILLDGKDIWADKNDIRSVRFKVGLVFQYPEYQIFEETVYKDIAFGPINMGLDKTEIDRRVRETAHDLGLSEELMERSPFELSGGQKRRVAIAGTPEGIAEVSAVFADMKARVIPLNVAGAFHSKLMQTAADKFYEAAKAITFKAPQVKYYSNVTGGELNDFSDMPALLAKHIVSPVRFTSELEAMRNAGADRFAEFGPGRTLTGLVKKTLKDVSAYSIENLETLEGAAIYE